MSLHQILTPPLPTVEDAMDDVVLTPYHSSESAFKFEGWQQEPQSELLHLLLHSPQYTTTAPSTASSPEAVIYSVPLQFQLQYHKGIALA